MTVTIDKKFFIRIGIVALLCVASFCAGRFIRFNNVSKTSEKLEQTIIQASADQEKVIDSLVKSGESLASAQKYGTLIYGIMSDLKNENAKLAESNEKLKETMEANREAIDLLLDVYNTNVDNNLQMIDLMIERAEKYEEILGKLNDERE